MKSAIPALVSLTLLSCSSLYAEADNIDREFAKKDLVLTFASSDEASKWSLESLDLIEWVKAVSLDEWQLLHKSQTPEFYFALFRYSDHLIFWNLDRKKPYSRSNGSIAAKDSNVGRVAIGPSEWVSLNLTRRYPNGSIPGRLQGDATKIKKDFEGQIIVSYSVGKHDGKEAKVFTESIDWTATAEQAGTDQPATKPADKPPVKDQPSTPTSKDGPR